MSDQPLLEVSNLVKTFGELTANDHVSVSVDRGEVRGVIGPNGSGKTTFFDTISGFHDPDGGSVHLNGTDITGWKPHRIARAGMGRTFQIVSPFTNMTVRQNLLAVETPSDVDDGERADEILTFLELDDIADHDASGMSGGQQKLLELARVLMLDPDCVLLDEPTAGVNPVLEQRIIEYIDELNDRGTTFVVVEHDMELIESVADVVSVFAQGKHLTQGTFDEVTSDERVKEAYLGRGTEEVSLL